MHFELMAIPVSKLEQCGLDGWTMHEELAGWSCSELQSAAGYLGGAQCAVVFQGQESHWCCLALVSVTRTVGWSPW